MRQRVLVTVRREEETDGGRDLELPSELRADELTRQLGTALHWPRAGSDLRVRIEPGGRVLEAGESLAEAGAADGAWLVFSSASPPAEPAAATPEWPTFMSSRLASPKRRTPTRLVLVLGGGVVMLSVAGLLVLRPAPAASPVATSVPTAAPTFLPTLEPTPLPAQTLEPTPLPPLPTIAPIIQPTHAPTAPPPTSRASPTAPPRLPTVVATTVAQDATSQWTVVLGQLDLLWDRDWPRAIEVTQGFLDRYPGYAPAIDKLYVALVAYGQQLKLAGRVDEARAVWEGADVLLPQRGEARAELEALTAPRPPQAQEPPPAISAPSRPAPAPVRVAQPPPPPPVVVEAQPPQKLTVTRDGFTPPENDR